MNTTEFVILLVEDEIEIRRFVRQALENDGCQVLEAGTLSQGLQDATTHKPDLIVLDLGLPDGDGVEFDQRLRSWSNIPVLVLSARSAELS